MKKAAIVLCGCGSRDGSEVHEATCTLLALVKAGLQPCCYAPELPQARVVNHLNGESVAEQRSMLIEAARIARGEIQNLVELRAQDADLVVFPGGFGAAFNLCDFAEKGSDCSVNTEVERVINEFHQAGKPLGFVCIAPVLAGRVLGSRNVELTIGNDPGTIKVLEGWGVRHVEKTATEIHIDQQNKVVSTPAYMLAKNIAEVDAGISKLVQALLSLRPCHSCT